MICFLNRPFLEICSCNSKETSAEKHCGIVVLDASVRSHLCDLYVPKVQERRQELEDGPLLFYTDTDDGKRVLS